LAKADQIAWLVARDFGDSLFDLDAIDQSLIPKDLVDEKIVRQFSVVPIFKRGSRIFVAMSDPTRVDALEAIRFASRLAVEAVVVEEDKLARLIEKLYENMTTADFSGFGGDVELDIETEGAEEKTPMITGLPIERLRLPRHTRG